MWLIFHHRYNLQRREDHRSLVVAVEIIIHIQYVYQKFAKCPAFGISKYISELFESEHLDKASEILRHRKL